MVEKLEPRIKQKFFNIQELRLHMLIQELHLHKLNSCAFVRSESSSSITLFIQDGLLSNWQNLEPTLAKN